MIGRDIDCPVLETLCDNPPTSLTIFSVHNQLNTCSRVPYFFETRTLTSVEHQFIWTFTGHGPETTLQEIGHILRTPSTDWKFLPRRQSNRFDNGHTPYLMHVTAGAGERVDIALCAVYVPMKGKWSCAPPIMFLYEVVCPHCRFYGEAILVRPYDTQMRMWAVSRWEYDDYDEYEDKHYIELFCKKGFFIGSYEFGDTQATYELIRMVRVQHCIPCRIMSLTLVDDMGQDIDDPSLVHPLSQLIRFTPKVLMNRVARPLLSVEDIKPAEGSSDRVWKRVRGGGENITIVLD